MKSNETLTDPPGVYYASQGSWPGMVPPWLALGTMSIHEITFLAAAALVVLGLVLSPWPKHRTSPEVPRVLWTRLLRMLGPASRGRLLVAALPGILAALAFHGLAVHVRLVLGRWPNFGESVPGWAGVHLQLVWVLMGSLWFVFVASPLLVVLALAWPRARPWVASFLVLGASIGLAYASMFLAPGPFQNWFFD